ncbi:hypothetical protein MRB53_021804 [Persea americana]|uniref:Uncharacterized protein n=1 Tax=Persea americana TaxID=3435 RepID=A0ACC2L4S5_PERAE|nr:hypothetical protein MRB53_021804 [Persea americana]
MAQVSSSSWTQIRQGLLWGQEIRCIAIFSKCVPFLRCESKCAEHGGPALVFNGSNCPTAAGAQVSLTIEEEEYDFAGASSKFKQCIPALHAIEKENGQYNSNDVNGNNNDNNSEHANHDNNNNNVSSNNNGENSEHESHDDIQMPTYAQKML